MDEVAEKPRDTSNITWGPVAAVLMTFAIFFGGQILGILVFLIGLAIFSRSPLQAAFDSLANADTAYQFYSVVAVEAVTIGLLYMFLRSRRAGFRNLGLGALRLGDVAKALAGYGVYFVCYYLVVIAIGVLIPSINLNQEQEIGFDRTVNGLALVPVFISLVALPALVEEMVMRGFLFPGLRTKLSFMASTLITSLLFAVAHLQWGSNAPLLWIAAVDTFILSIVLCYLRERTGSLWAPITVHAIKNTIAFAVLFLFKIA